MMAIRILWSSSSFLHFAVFSIPYKSIFLKTISQSIFSSLLKLDFCKCNLSIFSGGFQSLCQQLERVHDVGKRSDVVGGPEVNRVGYSPPAAAERHQHATRWRDGFCHSTVAHRRCCHVPQRRRNLLQCVVDVPKAAWFCQFTVKHNQQTADKYFAPDDSLTGTLHVLYEDIKSAPSLLVFRWKLKMHLFRQSYPDIIL